MQGENDFLLGTLPICLAHYITYPDFRALFSGYTLQSPARTVEIDGGTACFFGDCALAGVGDTDITFELVFSQKSVDATPRHRFASRH